MVGLSKATCGARLHSASVVLWLRYSAALYCILRCAALGHRHEASTHGIAGSDAVGRHENPACVLCRRGREGQKRAALRCVQLALAVCSRHGRPTRGRRKYRTCTVQYGTAQRPHSPRSLARPPGLQHSAVKVRSGSHRITAGQPDTRFTSQTHPVP